MMPRGVFVLLVLVAQVEVCNVCSLNDLVWRFRTLELAPLVPLVPLVTCGKLRQCLYRIGGLLYNTGYELADTYEVSMPEHNQSRLF